ncbi:ParA family protein [Gammaproteobacteria bacterium]|nr:ParA family protein [Gammaproteobacteria bacterium]
MPNILFASTKGGCGKTTLTHVVTIRLAERGHRVLVVDLDNQGNLSQSFNDFESHYPTDQETSYTLLTADSNICPIKTEYGLDLLAATPALVDIERVDPLKIYRTIRRNLLSLDPQYDFVFFDTPGAYSVLTSAAMSVADYIAMPLFLDRYNIDALERTGDLMENVESVINPTLTFLGFIPCSVEGTTLGLPTRIAQRDIYRILVKNYGDSYLFPIVREREYYRRLQLDSRLQDDPIASDDIDSVCDYLIKKMENEND